MGYRTRQLEMEIRLLKEELFNLKKTVDILERQHLVETRYGSTLSPFHKTVVPKVETRKGEVEYKDLVKFVIDKQPIEFVDEYCEQFNCTRTRTLMPDGLVIERTEKRLK